MMIAAVISRYRNLLKLFKSDTVGGAIVSMCVAGSAAVIGFAMFATASRTMTVEAFGTFAIWFNAMSFLAMTAGLGQETLVMRLWPEFLGRRQFGLAKGTLVFGGIVTFLSASVVAMVTIAGGLLLGFSLSLAVSGAYFLFTLTLLIYTNHLARIIAGVVYSDGNRDVTSRMLIIISVLTMFSLGFSISAALVLTLAASAMLFVVFLHLTIIRKRLPSEVFEVQPHVRARKWLSRGKEMWFATIAEATSQFLEVIIVGIMLSNVVAGGFFIAQKIANIFAIIAGGISMYASRKISGFFFGKEFDELNSMLRMLAVIALLLVSSAVLTVIVAGHFVLSLFDVMYTREYYTLVILVAGTAGVTLAGPAPYLLMLTGHEKYYSRTMACILVLRFAALGAMVPLWGTIGAALAWSGSALLGAIILNFYCRRFVGVDPSVLILLRSWPYFFAQKIAPKNDVSGHIQPHGQ